MSGILCVWANLPDEAKDWYVNHHVPKLCAREPNHIHALYAEQLETGMEGQPAGVLESPWNLFTLYEERDIQRARESAYDKGNGPPEDMRPGPLKQARFDVRTYRELKRWQQDDWDGDSADICSISVMEWSIDPDMQDEVLTFWNNTIAPILSSSSELLRFRLFEIDNATVWQHDSYITKEKKDVRKFFTVGELENEQLPWQEVIELSQTKQWRNWFETQTVVKWQISHYLVKQAYPHVENYEEAEGNGKTEP